MKIIIYASDESDKVGSSTIKRVFDNWELPLPRKGDWLMLDVGDEWYEYEVKSVMFDLEDNNITLHVECP